MVSAVRSPAFLGWLYGQFSLVHLQPLQVKSAQILVGRSLGKISVALVSCFGEKEHAHVRDMALLGWVGSTVAAGLLLALDGSRFFTLVWGGRITLRITALIPVGVIWKGRSRSGSWSWGTHI